MDILAYFKEVLSEEEYANLITTKVIKKGAYIYIPPNKPLEMFQVKAGAVKIGTYLEDGTEVSYDILYRNEVFGNLRYLNGQFFEFAKALTDCRIVTIELGFYKKMIVHDPIISDWFNRSTIMRWCRMETRLFKICTMSPISRLQALFQEFSESVVDAKGATVSVNSLLTIVDVSQMSGLSRQTTSKLLKKLEKLKIENSSNSQYQFINKINSSKKCI
ncbi:Crp/Fnr family transcriptional regulator [Mongoliitalea daihaiensis]|uniref:Crp/Fnr family transcriptional regulator n=1 Tax=Mongoliitalea daihaiensis TaxID=2782006 RepID=UPI001F2B75E7|nr:Crp/Fnr family transcriptional regulator [Mongoliitalea daihaiensis]UJP65098.1 Crp/Fnr family transcriptional regulator [Mongoliitalea daihaiensis]